MMQARTRKPRGIRFGGPVLALGLLVASTPGAVTQEAPTQTTPSASSPEVAAARVAPAAEGPRVAFVGATIHTMTGGSGAGTDAVETLVGATLLIRGDRIEAVGIDLELPAGTERYDVSGLHIVPGLIDGMVSFTKAHDELFIANGITVVRDMGGERTPLLLARRREARDRAPGPLLLTAGALVGGDPPSTAEAIVLRNPDAAEALLPYLVDDEVDFFSIFKDLDLATWQRVIKLAHDWKLEVWGPVPDAVDFQGAIRAGQDGIIYLDRMLPAAEGVDWRNVQPAAFRPSIQLLANNETALVPALFANAVRLRDQSADSNLPVLLRLLSPSIENWWMGELKTRLAVWEQQPSSRTVGKLVVDKQRALVKAMFDAGVRLLPGSAAPNPWLFPGQALISELGEWENAGIPSIEALRAATAGAADILGVSEDHGRLRAGCYADFLCVKNDPREGVVNLLTPAWVGVRGRLFDEAGIEDLYQTVDSEQSRARKVLLEPLQIEPPEAPEGTVVLEGLVETYALGQKVAGERFQVVRLPDGRVSYCGRKRTPATGDTKEGELLVTQTVKDGRLDEFRVEVRVADGGTLSCDGLWTANKLQLHRETNGLFLANNSTNERPVCLDVGSVTSLFVLGQQKLERPFPVLSFHESLDFEMGNWAMELDDRGNHQVRTHMGRMAFNFDDQGAPSQWVLQIGQSQVQSQLTNAEAFGGAGYPLPEWKRAIVRAAESAASVDGPDPAEAEPPDAPEDDAPEDDGYEH